VLQQLLIEVRTIQILRTALGSRPASAAGALHSAPDWGVSSQTSCTAARSKPWRLHRGCALSDQIRNMLLRLLLITVSQCWWCGWAGNCSVTGAYCTSRARLSWSSC